MELDVEPTVAIVYAMSCWEVLHGDRGLDFNNLSFM
jgi:hypothetical protein